jgi:hypothetical protein
MAVTKDDRRYWVVSPNVGNNEATVSDWRQASVAGHAAFIGWHSNDRGHGASGHKFAHSVKPGDVILIARSHQNEPEIVGFGVVRGKFQTTLKGVRLPYRPGSIRRLSPFLPRSRVPMGMPLLSVLTWTRALAELHPKTNSTHKKLCDWVEKELKRDRHWANGGNSQKRVSTKARKTKRTASVRIGSPPGSFQEDYTVRTTQQVKTEKKREAALVARYTQWLKRQGRALRTVLYTQLRCDGYEQDRGNLIEAKSSASREHLRMAVGQLADYSYQGKEKFGEPNKGVLVPEKPSQDLISWLASMGISIIWPKKKMFLDTANGQFT